MRLSIDIPMKPVTLNTANKYSVVGKRVMTRKSEKALWFEQCFRQQLDLEKQDEIHNFALHYASLDNPCIVAGYTITLENFWTSKGFMSKTCLDLENGTKYATDLLFKEIKKTFKDCDDSQIVRLFSDKWHGDNGIRIDLESFEIEEYVKRMVMA